MLSEKSTSGQNRKIRDKMP